MNRVVGAPGSTVTPAAGERPRPAGRVVDEERVLDAAHESLLAVGLRRTTLSDVARRAGVSRMTLYRRWPDLRTLVRDVMTREWLRVVAATMPPRDPATTSGRTYLAATVAGTTLGFRGNALFRRIVELDPELLLPYVLDRRGTTQDVILDLITRLVDDGHADGSVRPGDTAVQARMLLMTVQSFVLSADAAGAGVPADRLADELRVLIDTYLAPGRVRETETP